jgi:hypothetical protein
MARFRLNGWKRLWIVTAVVSFLVIWGGRQWLVPPANAIKYEVYHAFTDSAFCRDYWERKDSASLFYASVPTGCSVQSLEDAIRASDKAKRSYVEANATLDAEHTDWWIITIGAWLAFNMLVGLSVVVTRWVYRGFRHKEKSTS